jgi:hypothetical protein
MSSPAYSQDAGDRDGGEIASAESEFLFINMLEFLGEFETGDGEWISPEVLANEAFADLDAGANDEIIDQAAREQRVLSASGDDE